MPVHEQNTAAGITVFGQFIGWLIGLCSGAELESTNVQIPVRRPPNVIVIFMDDLGYADIEPFGQPSYSTPELARMAREGRCLTDFVVSSAVCSASRAALLTGCYHERVGIRGALGPNSSVGLAPSEFTLAELCQQQGYATGCFGKWHLGDAPEFLPTAQGFERYWGLPYSNDMWPLHPDFAELPADAVRRKANYPDLPLYSGSQIENPRVTGGDQAQLTRRYTEMAIDFIREHRDRPFFLYLPHTMVHVPLFASEHFSGRSGRGLYADVMQEIDWSVGQVLQTLRELGISEQTLVIFTSDNGPWLSYGDHAGSAGKLREGKGTMWEGGARVPMIAWWPGRIPANSSCGELASTIDILPTVAALLQAPAGPNPLDGQDIGALLWENSEDVRSPHSSFFYYYDGELRAVRDRRWKLVFPHRYRSLDGQPGGTGGRPASYVQLETPQALFDLHNDPGESQDVSAAYPAEVARLSQAAKVAREKFGDHLQKVKGNEVRGPGQRATPPHLGPQK